MPDGRYIRSVAQSSLTCGFRRRDGRDSNPCQRRLKSDPLSSGGFYVTSQRSLLEEGHGVGEAGPQAASWS
jgi:hypothetical protein